jgi:acetyl-CoA carboxylase biotin carboxyl carrier protein
MNINEIQSLIKFVAKSGVTEVELETEDFKIIIKTPKSGDGEMYVQQVPVVQQQHFQVAQAPTVQAATPAASTPPNVETDKNVNANYVTIKSPMVGTFYRSANPESAPFVNVGDEVKLGKVVSIIEAMKLFNEIESEVSGKIVKVLVDDASPVEYDQPLFLVDPS